MLTLKTENLTLNQNFDKFWPILPLKHLMFWASGQNFLVFFTNFDLKNQKFLTWKPKNQNIVNF